MERHLGQLYLTKIFVNSFFQNAVIKIVREKYFHTSSFTNQEELQEFLSDLYVFLIDEMHKGLNKVRTDFLLYIFNLYKHRSSARGHSGLLL